MIYHIDSPIKLMWSDVLHYKWMSDRETDQWDVGAYVRSVVVNSCVVIEAYLANVSGCNDIGYSVKRKLEEHVKLTNGRPIDWGTGWAQKLLALLEMRKDIIHRVTSLSENELKPKSNIADAVVGMAKDIFECIYIHWNKTDDKWWNYEQYEDYKKENCLGFMSIKKSGYNESDGIELIYKWKDKECVHSLLPGYEQWDEYWDSMIRELRGPISYVAARKNGKILREMHFVSRGI